MKLTEEYILTELKKFATTHKDYGLIITERNAERFAEDVVKNRSIPTAVGQSKQLKAVEKLKDFAYEVCPLHREDDLEEIVGSL